MDKYKIVFDMLDEKIKQNEIVEKTGFTLDTVKKVSQLKKIYCKVESYTNDKVLLNKLRCLKFKALELKKIIDNEELIEEFLEYSNPNMKTKDIKNKVNELITRSERLEIAKNEYTDKKQSLEKKELELKETINDLEKKEQEIFEAYPFLEKVNSNVREYLLKTIGVYKNEYVLKDRLSIEIDKDCLPVMYIHKEKLWRINNLDAFISFVEQRVSNKQSVLWEESDYFKKNDSYDIWYGSRVVFLTKNEGKYKKGDMLKSLGTYGLRKQISGLKKELKEIRKELKVIRKTASNNFKEDVLFVDSITEAEIAEHRLVQDIFLKKYLQEFYVSAAEITIDNKRFDTVMYKPDNLIIGEVKASRSDFISDSKYLTYSEYCNELDMILSSKVKIKEEEIQKLKNEGVGLFIVDTSTKEIKKVHSSLRKEISKSIKCKVFKKMIKTLNEKVGEK